MDVGKLLIILNRYSLSSFCLSDYVRWLGQKANIDIRHNDLISTLETEDVEHLEKLESLLSDARHILGLTETQFKPPQDSQTTFSRLIPRRCMIFSLSL